MAEKYPFLRHRKQHVISIETSRWKVAGVERAVVVTAERRHLTTFVSRDDATWAAFERVHYALDRTPTSPSGTSRIRWSGQIGIVSDERTLAICSKRRMDPDGTSLRIDLLGFDSSGGGTLTQVGSSPVQVPIADLGLEETGFWLRAVHADGILVLITQGVSSGSASLVLLVTDAPDLRAVDTSGRWRRIDLDRGGYDLDALSHGRLLEIVHRRTPGYLTVPRKKMPSPDDALLVDEPQLSIPQLSDMLAPLVRVTVDLTTLTNPVIDATLPPAEHPQILRAEPFLVTGDRLLIGELRTMTWSDGQPYFRFRTLQADKIVIRNDRDHDRWLLDRLYWTAPDLVPRHLGVLRGSQQLLGRTDEVFELGTLIPQHPVAILADQVDEKQDRVVLAHEHRLTGTLVATTFRLSIEQDPPRLRAVSEGFAVLDIGREQLGDSFGVPDRAENAQFEPLHDVGPHDHADGFRIQGPRFYRNTMGGAVVSPIDRGACLYAYLDMGDAGLRVFYQNDVTAPPPAAPPDVKILEPAMVPGPGGEEQAWIDLVAPMLVDARVPAYRAPYADFIRGLQDPESGVVPGLVVGLLLAVGAIRLADDYLEPPSLHGSMQPALDLLPLSVALTSDWDFETSGVPLSTEEVTLTVAEANAVETFMMDTSGSVRIESEDGTPFPVTVVQEPAAVFPGADVSFRAESGTAGLDFTWTFQTNPDAGEDAEVETEAGASVTRTFDRPGGYAVVLDATNANGDTVTIEWTVTVAQTLWDTLWSPFDSVVRSDQFELGELKLSLLQYRLEFLVDAAGNRDRVSVRWRDEVPSRLRFLGGGITQGRVDYRLVVGFTTASIRLAGLLAAAVNVDSVSGSYLYGRPFTPSVLTSDRRREDPVRRRRFPVPVETAQRSETDGLARRPVSAPAGLAMKPVGASTLDLDTLEVQTSLTDAAGAIGWLVGVLISLGLASAAAAGAVAAAIAALGPMGAIAGGIAVGLALAAIVVILAGLGLTWLLVEVIAPPLLQAAAQRIVRDQLRAGLPQMLEQLDEQGLLMYAGEGLAEALAVRVIRAAQTQGHDVSDAELRGRDRFRHAFFETIFVSSGICRVRVRVAGGGP